MTPNPLNRLLAPRHIAFFGGESAAEAIRQCKKLGFAGEVWPVHPRHTSIEDLPCFRRVADLPEAPDASFVAVGSDATLEIVAQLAERGAGGVVCYASGFAEHGDGGALKQQTLLHNAQSMAMLGPNCYGFLNFLDGVALWPDQHGGQRVERGVAIVTQSGNLGLNLTMQRRALPLAYLITVGNKAGVGLEALVESLLHDSRVTAIGLHIEGLDNMAAFSRVALLALEKGVPLVALKLGSSELGAQITMSHTRSLAGADALYSALFKRYGVARVKDPVSLLETLKFLHVHGAIKGRRITSASCSGGEASLVADLAQARNLDMPALPAPVQERLHEVLGEKVHVANPLDYHTYIWGQLAAQTACFSAWLESRFDAHLLVLDFPRLDRCSDSAWAITVQAAVDAMQGSETVLSVVASMPEGLPEAVAERLLQQGISPMQGLPDALDAVVCAAEMGLVRAQAKALRPLSPPVPLSLNPLRWLNEHEAKKTLNAWGIPVPQGDVVNADQAGNLADQLGYPVVVKAVSSSLAHKTEAGGVHLGLQNRDQVANAVAAMSRLSDRFLVERMAQRVVAEVLVGVFHDPQFGQVLTLGAGGIWVELLKDSVSLLLPASRQEITVALRSLRCWALLDGFRGRPKGDVDALLEAIMAVQRYALAHQEQLSELDLNPIMVLPKGRGVVAVDALICIAQA